MTGRHYGKCLLYLQQLGCIRWKDKFTRGWRGLGKHLSQPVWTEWLFYSCYSAFSDRACGENVTPTFQLTKHWDYRSKHHTVDDLTVIGSAALVAPATAGSTNFARTIIAHLLTWWSHWSDATVLDDYAMTMTIFGYIGLIITYYYYYTCIYNARTFSSGRPMLNQRRWQSHVGCMVRVLMGYRYLKMWVFRRHLKVSKMGESLILRGSPFQTVGAK